ncbi:alpha-ketoglutarate-dependent dioxygenase alkB homolog 4-like [Liolophura sinensis]|uniref:alpha-ketoglutarate-dependent dioxygenase alkB homolog 4-like n=1 Tax=Liolophura sinensis TaxID=3198878 RepID=UPI00315902AC
MLNGDNVCGCKGIRTCLLCEQLRPNGKPDSEVCRKPFSFCIDCGKAWPKGDNSKAHPEHEGESFKFDGVHIIRDFVSAEEEEEICHVIEQTPFVQSQSGRRKQDYGPKVNFKRKKVKLANFTGLPAFSEVLFERMKRTSILKDFIPVELCNLDYNPDRGSAIDPHFDDFWIWGDRLVTLNLLSDSILSMTNEEQPHVEIQLPLLRRSLIVIFGPARQQWKHAIHRKHITSRRLAVTLRELSREFLPGGSGEEIGAELCKIALTFSGTAVGSPP